MIKCIKAESYKDKDGSIYIDWFGECENGLMIHIPKLEVSMKDIEYKYDLSNGKNVTCTPVYRCIATDIISKENQIYYLAYDQTKDNEQKSLSNEISVFSDDKVWLKNITEYYILRGYKIVSESYLDGKHYCDLVKE